MKEEDNEESKDLIQSGIDTTPIPKEEWPRRGASGNTIKEVFTLSDREYELVIDKSLPTSTPCATIHGFKLCRYSA